MEENFLTMHRGRNLIRSGARKRWKMLDYYGSKGFLALESLFAVAGVVCFALALST
jgi:hypothetical protein